MMSAEQRLETELESLSAIGIFILAASQHTKLMHQINITINWQLIADT